MAKKYGPELGVVYYGKTNEWEQAVAAAGNTSATPASQPQLQMQSSASLCSMAQVEDVVTTMEANDDDIDNDNDDENDIDNESERARLIDRGQVMKNLATSKDD
jgi:hypothetical protein